MRLPDDAEVSDELWDEVIECMQLRIEDKVSVIRTYAVRALSRFANDSEDGDILELLLKALDLEQTAVSSIFPLHFLLLRNDSQLCLYNHKALHTGGA